MLSPLNILSLDQGRLYRADRVPPESEIGAVEAAAAVVEPARANRFADLARRLAAGVAGWQLSRPAGMARR
jgi:hypothetical protein